MNVTVSLDHRFSRTPDGVVWSRSFPFAFWSRYLTAFDAVRVVARVRDVEVAPAESKPASGENVSFAPSVYYHGINDYLRKIRDVQASYRAAIGENDAVILRIPGQTSSGLWDQFQSTGRPYGVEVIGDPYDSFAPGAYRHPLRPFLRWRMPRQMKKQCAAATCASYVTREALQKPYPPSPGAYATHYSSIELTDAWLAPPPSRDFSRRPLTLITVGTMDQLYKGQDVLLEALAQCTAAGQDLKLVLLGDGIFKSQLEAQAQQLGLTERVHFMGHVSSGDAVREQLDKADLFVLPSRQEGLPRALIEAMSRGLPGIASTVGGTGELIPPEDMVAPDDARGLATRIQEVTASPERMRHMAARNRETAQEYSQYLLEKRRTAFYLALREQTEQWLRSRG